MVNRLATAQSTVAICHWRPAAIVTLAAVAALTALTADAAPKQARPAQPQEATAPRDAGEPIMAIVSIKSQQVVFYDADGWILRAPVSTGTKERETPAGVFAVVDKEVDHRSNMYDDAWMPHMQRITWNGIALHGGPLPGYAASHGCVRMPFGFADKLFNKTRIGMRVIIAPDDPAPVDFSHPALLVPKAEAIAAAPARPRRSPARPRKPPRPLTQPRKLPRSGARDSVARGVAAQADIAQGPRRCRTRGRRQGARGRKNGPGEGAGRGAEAEGRFQGRGSGEAARHRNGRREVEARCRRCKGRRQGGRGQEGRHRQGGARCEARARAGLDLHQPRHAEALRAAQHAQTVAGRGRSVRFQHRGPGHDPQSRQTDKHACVHRDGA